MSPLDAIGHDLNARLLHPYQAMPLGTGWWVGVPGSPARGGCCLDLKEGHIQLALANTRHAIPLADPDSLPQLVDYLAYAGFPIRR